MTEHPLIRDKRAEVECKRAELREQSERIRKLAFQRQADAGETAPEELR